MSDSNKGVTGPASLRLFDMKVSELPFAYREDVNQQLPAFLEEQRKLKVNRITSRYPRGNADYFQSRILECQSNIHRFAKLKQDCMVDIGRYMDLMKNREGDLSQVEVDTMTSEIVAQWTEDNRADPELVKDGRAIPGTFGFHRLMAELKKVNVRLRLYEDEALWVQVGLFQESRDRYDDAAKTETDSIFQLREAIMNCHERDRLIKQAMTEPLSVE